jgi:hypothetical protein
MPTKKRNAIRLIVAGLLGLALFQIVARFAPSSVLASDAVQGGWIGFCIGLELMGLLLYKSGQFRDTR